jgi:hypothetical protein
MDKSDVGVRQQEPAECSFRVPTIRTNENIQNGANDEFVC